MVVVSYSGKEINAKLVYYGAGLSGKTTNLESIYEAVPDTSRGKMVSMKTQSDRTLFFDLLPLDLGEIMGFKTRFLLYTVPGQVFYNATRKLVLKGADAIVFVADSEVGKMEENKESLANLKANLAEYGLNLDAIPWVMQYNKRDLPNVYSLDELNAELNAGGKVPFFEAVATQGKGVFETFRGISHMLMEKVTRDLRRGPTSGAVKSAPATPAAPAPNAGAASLFGGSSAAPATNAKSDGAARPLGPGRVDTAAPGAPGREIQQEARHAEPAPAGRPVDYGREIELPSQVPPAAAPDANRPEPAPAAKQPGPAPAAPAPAAKHQPGVPSVPAATPEPVAPQPEPVAVSAQARPAAPPAPQAKPFAPAAKPAVPAHGGSPVAPAQPAHAAGHEAPSIGPAARGGHSPSARAQIDAESVVVPVRIPKGGSREIVLRIVISSEDDAHA